MPAENIHRKWIADTGSGHDLIGQSDIGGDYDIEQGKTIRLKTIPSEFYSDIDDIDDSRNKVHFLEL